MKAKNPYGTTLFLSIINTNRGSSKRHNFDLVRRNETVSLFTNGSEKCNEEFILPNVLLLFHLKLPGVTFVGQYTFEKYLEFTKPLNDVDDRFNCMFLRWATESETD